MRKRSNNLLGAGAAHSAKEVVEDLETIEKSSRSVKWHFFF